MLNGKKKAIAFALLAFVVLAWIGVAASLWLLEPSLAQWTLIVTAAALASEGAIWVGAVLLGIEAFARLRAKFRLRRSS
jgi:hypothetical protein